MRKDRMSRKSERASNFSSNKSPKRGALTEDAIMLGMIYAYTGNKMPVTKPYNEVELRAASVISNQFAGDRTIPAKSTPLFMDLMESELNKRAPNLAEPPASDIKLPSDDEIAVYLESIKDVTLKKAKPLKSIDEWNSKKVAKTVVSMHNTNGVQTKPKKELNQTTNLMVHFVEKVDVTTNEFLQTFTWRKLRMETIKRYGARCQCCGASPAIDNDVIINVDHIKPRKLFPELAIDGNNLQVLCNPCNQGKGNWDKTDWRK